MRIFILAVIIQLLSPHLWAMDFAITIQGVPSNEKGELAPLKRTQQIIYALFRQQVPPAGVFANYSNHPEAVKQLKAYDEAGSDIGNSTADGLDLTQSTTEQFAGSISRADKFLKPYQGYKRFFRYPKADISGGDPQKEVAIREYLLAQGYRPGIYTIDSYDWLLQQVIKEKVADDYMVDWEVARKMYRKIVLAQVQAAYQRLNVINLEKTPQIIIFSENDVTALFLADILSDLKNSGNNFISYNDAYRYYLKNKKNLEVNFIINPVIDVFLQDCKSTTVELRKLIEDSEMFSAKNFFRRATDRVSKVTHKLF